MELSTGEIVVIAAADDVSLPYRVSKTCEAYLKSNRTALSIFSSCILIDGSGAEVRLVPITARNEPTLESLISAGTYVYGCTHAWHRKVFDKFGPLPLEVRQEDEVIPFRSLLLGKILSIEEPLVRYRLHSSNASLEYKNVATNRDELQKLYNVQRVLRLVNLKSYLRDLEIAGDRVEDERRKSIRIGLLSAIDNCELEIAFAEGDFRKRLAVLRKGMKGTTTAKTLLKWIFRLFLPGVHARYSYYKYHKRLKGDMFFGKDLERP